MHLISLFADLTLPCLPTLTYHLDYGQSNLWKNQIHEMLGEKLVTDFWGQSREK